MRNESFSKTIDWGLLSVFLLMILIGVANVYSAAFDPKSPELFDFSQ